MKPEKKLSSSLRFTEWILKKKERSETPYYKKPSSAHRKSLIPLYFCMKMYIFKDLYECYFFFFKNPVLVITNNNSALVGI